MDIIGNWELLNDRIKEEKPDLIPHLMKIHIDSFEDLRKNGHNLSIEGESISDIAHRVDATERLELVGNVGRSLIEASGDLMEKHFRINMSELFPNCIFIGLAAIIENLEGGFDAMFPDKKMLIDCHYQLINKDNDPLKEMLPLLVECYPWVDLRINETKTSEKNNDSSNDSEGSELKDTKQESFFGRIKHFFVD